MITDDMENLHVLHLVVDCFAIFSKAILLGVPIDIPGHVTKCDTVHVFCAVGGTICGDIFG